MSDCHVQSTGYSHLTITLVGKRIFSVRHDFAGCVELRVRSCVLSLYGLLGVAGTLWALRWQSPGEGAPRPRPCTGSGIPEAEVLATGKSPRHRRCGKSPSHRRCCRKASRSRKQFTSKPITPVLSAVSARPAGLQGRGHTLHPTCLD